MESESSASLESRSNLSSMFVLPVELGTRLGLHQMNQLGVEDNCPGNGFIPRQAALTEPRPNRPVRPASYSRSFFNGEELLIFASKRLHVTTVYNCVMGKNVTRPSHQIIDIRFRFLRLPVTWEVLEGNRWDEYKASCLRRVPSKALLNGVSVPPPPLLYGRLKVKAAEVGTFPVTEDLDAVRAEFFDLPEGDLHSLAAFLNTVGAWPSSGDPSQSLPGHQMRFPLTVEPQAIWDFRRDLRHAMLNPSQFKEFLHQMRNPRSWLELSSQEGAANGFTVQFELFGPVVASVTLTNARHMLFAAALSDLARGIRFKRCKRRDCTGLVPVKKGSLKKYHTTRCERRALMRRRRAAGYIPPSRRKNNQ